MRNIKYNTLKYKIYKIKNRSKEGVGGTGKRFQK